MELIDSRRVSGAFGRIVIKPLQLRTLTNFLNQQTLWRSIGAYVLKIEYNRHQEYYLRAKPSAAMNFKNVFFRDSSLFPNSYLLTDLNGIAPLDEKMRVPTFYQECEFSIYSPQDTLTFKIFYTSDKNFETDTSPISYESLLSSNTLSPIFISTVYIHELIPS